MRQTVPPNVQMERLEKTVNKFVTAVHAIMQTDAVILKLQYSTCFIMLTRYL